MAGSMAELMADMKVALTVDTKVLMMVGMMAESMVAWMVG